MTRLTPFFWLATGLLVGLLGGTLVTAGIGALPSFNFDQVVARAGETPLTRGMLAERTLFRYGTKVLDDEMRREAIYTEAARRAGVVVTDAEVSKRIDDYQLLLKQYADLPALMGSTYDFDSVPRWMLEDQFRISLYAEKVFSVTVSPADIDKMYADRLYMNGFTKPAMANLTLLIARTKNDATVMWNRLRAGEDPAKVSAQSSYLPSIRKVRGELGWVARDGMSKEVSAAIFDVRQGKGLKAGEYTPVLTYNTTATDTRTNRQYVTTDYIIMYVHDIIPAKVVLKQEVLPVLDMLVRLNKVSLAETQADPKTGKTKLRELEEAIPWQRIENINIQTAQPVTVPLRPLVKPESAPATTGPVIPKL